MNLFYVSYLSSDPKSNMIINVSDFMQGKSRKMKKLIIILPESTINVIILVNIRKDV